MPKGKRLIGLVISCCFLISGCGETAGKTQSQIINQNDAQEEAKKKINQDAQEVFSEITQNYGFSKFLDTWGGEKKLFLPESAWFELSDSKQQILISYATHNKISGIIVGKQKSSNTIYVDRTIWGR